MCLQGLPQRQGTLHEGAAAVLINGVGSSLIQGRSYAKLGRRQSDGDGSVKGAHAQQRYVLSRPAHSLNRLQKHLPRGRPRTFAPSASLHAVLSWFTIHHPQVICMNWTQMNSSTRPAMPAMEDYKQSSRICRRHGLRHVSKLKHKGRTGSCYCRGIRLARKMPWAGPARVVATLGIAVRLKRQYYFSQKAFSSLTVQHGPSDLPPCCFFPASLRRGLVLFDGLAHAGSRAPLTTDAGV